MSGACPGIDVGFVDLSYAQVAVLGVVQGITELLPISSTAHMRLVPALLGWRDPGAAFSAAMQLAALLGVVSYFRRDLTAVAAGSTSALLARRFDDPQLRLATWIVLATVPIALAGALLSSLLNRCDSPLRTLPAIGGACLAMASLLALAEVLARHRRDLASGTLRDAVLIGIAQVGALIPGVSRSGSTLTAALGLGFKREEAARFSFLLGVPAIALAGLKELWELHRVHLDPHGWSVLAVGIGVGGVTAVFAIWGLMRFLERFSTWPFIAYRALLGLALLVGEGMGWLS